MNRTLSYPTPQHAAAAAAAADFFRPMPGVGAVILTGSCGRGRGSAESDLDLAVLVPPETPAEERRSLETRWNEFYRREAAFARLEQVGVFTHVDVEIVDGCFVPRARGWTSGPDEFELEIGNTLVYGTPLWERGDCVERLCREWLPYYSEPLRQQRLAEALRFCHNNLDHVPGLVERELYFQAFKRLYDAFREFLQALFIAHRTYPIAYDKWIREQVADILGLPGLYRQLPGILEIGRFESPDIARRAGDLERLLREYVS